ncbi:unnamed protein product [Vicia faba]|uniref:Dof zinc finger protein n=1 Tax=Vicia faba TaxID=3906 RepID=A0AAV1B9N0_VICFA|nr:unnamed protein product [Vicia faba]
MGLSSKQVISSTGLDWKQTLLESQDLELPKPHHLMRKQQQSPQQQSAEHLKCPRCDSTNTKFCYYNNYNKSQPRHFCRACKRHWTKGGTLRNVPVGGGRKNKRVKKSTTTPVTSSTTTTTAAAAAATATTACTTSIQTPDLQNMMMMDTRDLLESKDFGMFTTTSSTLPIPHQNQSLLFPFSTSSSSFDTTTCSSSNVYYYGQEFKTMEEQEQEDEPIIPNTKPWETPIPIPIPIPTSLPLPATSGGMEASKYWNWEDIDSLVSADLKDPYWDDSDIKP